MPRLARRLPRPEPEPASLLGARWLRPSIRWLRAAWPGLSLLAAAGVVLMIETRPPWNALGAALQSIDFDPARVALIQAWLAAVIFATLAAVLSGRPWGSALAAALFVALTYALPLGAQIAGSPPALFGVKEQLKPDALHLQQAGIVAIAYLVAIPAAATGDLLRRSLLRVALDAWTLIARRPEAIGPPARALGGSLLVVAVAAVALAVSPVADPLLRNGPGIGVYVPGPLPSRTLSAGPGGWTSTQYPPEPIPAHGRLVNASYHSAAMNEDRAYRIYLPPTYSLRAAAHRRYPVLYLLHGDPGDPSSWVSFGAIDLFDTGIATGTLSETILVLPDGEGHVTVSTQWANRFSGGDPIESAFLELVATVDREYRTLADRQDRVLAGLSSGAFGAANLAGRHPDQFSVAISLSGYFIASGPVFGHNAAYARANSPYYLVQDQPTARTVRYLLTVGDHDFTYRRANEAFAAQLARFNVSHAYSVIAGAHGADIWLRGLAVGMAELKATLSPHQPVTEQ